MQDKVARIINQNAANEDQAIVDGLRTLAGFPIRRAEVSEQCTRHRVVNIERDAAGNIVRSIERIEEIETSSHFGTWIR